MPAGCYVGGVLWEKDAIRPPQTVHKLTHDEALSLQAVDRMSCLQEAVGPEAHLHLLDKTKQGPQLLITGRNAGAQKAVDAALGKVLRMLQKDEGIVVSVHPHDISILRNQHCMLMAEVERESGCRILAEDPPKETFKDPNVNRHQHCVRLLGDQVAQARAVQMLTYHCMHPVVPLE